MSKTRCRGLSLLEVMLALAILGGALTVLGMHIRTGARSAAIARDSTTAQLLAESKMAEIAAGVILPDTVYQEPADETGEWLCSVESLPIDQEGLLGVQVVVEQDPTFTTQPVSFKLTRWIVDPQVEADMKVAAAEVRKSIGATANQGTAAAGGLTDAAKMGAAAGGAGAGGLGGGGAGGNGQGGNGRGGQGNQGNGPGNQGNGNQGNGQGNQSNGGNGNQGNGQGNQGGNGRQGGPGGR
jgi:prepilin-type N-terminal cleavage/methylation domain-containing protein